MRDYTDASAAEVLEHAHELVGMSLRGLYGEDVDVPRGKGAFGQLVERHHFGYAPNPDPEQDFPVAGLELKATGAVKIRHEWCAKERLVLSNINYGALAGEETFEASTFYSKNSRLLLVVYFWVADTSPLDYVVLGVGVVDLTRLDSADRQIIREDWEKIRRSVLDGRAHELSEGDTMYLKACRKGAGTGLDDRQQPFSAIAAPNRAFSFRQSFLTRLIQPIIEAGRPRREHAQAITDGAELAEKTFDQVVMGRFENFIGRTVDDIAAEIGSDLNRAAKNFYARLARRMLGIRTRKIEEFEKADVVMKTVRIQPNGRPKESMSFPAFRYMDLVEQAWFESDLREALSRRFLFVFYFFDGFTYRFDHATFWAMPETTLDGDVRAVWEETVRRIQVGEAQALPTSRESRVAHVRPHGRDGRDTDVTPDGQHVVKKSFWLNAAFISEIYKSTRPA